MRIMNIPDITIAIDGYSSTGKSTLAKLIASEFAFSYLDSGAVYRCITLIAQEKGFIDSENNIDEQGLTRELDNIDIYFKYENNGNQTYIGNRIVEKEIRSLKVAEQVSPISTLPFVRNYVDKKLRELGGKKRVVMDGRDIGTTVFPDAEVKIFVTAQAEIRAQRRYKEMVAKGEKPVFENIVKNLEERDYIDSHREVSPLRKADDAFVLDNSDMTLREELIWAKGLIQGKFGLLQ